jgi:hypothetical protein
MSDPGYCGAIRRWPFYWHTYRDMDEP